MARTNGGNRSWIGNLFCAVIPIVAAVAGAAAGYWLNSHVVRLSFERFAPAHFEGTPPQSFFYAQVRNLGDKASKRLKVRLKLQSPATIVGQKAKPSLELTSVQAQVASSQDRVDFVIDQLGAGQFVSFSLWAQSAADQTLYIEALDEDGNIAKEAVQQDGGDGYVIVAFALGGLAFGILLSGWVCIRLNASADTRTLLGALGGMLARFPRSTVGRDSKNLRQFLTGDNLVLIFNPSMPKARKAISFNPEQTIGKGRNANEHTWRIVDGYLEIIRQDGTVHNRFVFDTAAKYLASTNEPDTFAVREHRILDQRIVRD